MTRGQWKKKQQCQQQPCPFIFSRYKKIHLQFRTNQKPQISENIDLKISKIDQDVATFCSFLKISRLFPNRYFISPSQVENLTKKPSVSSVWWREPFAIFQSNAIVFFKRPKPRVQPGNTLVVVKEDCCVLCNLIISHPPLLFKRTNGHFLEKEMSTCKT